MRLTYYFGIPARRELWLSFLQNKIYVFYLFKRLTNAYTFLLKVKASIHRPLKWVKIYNRHGTHLRTHPKIQWCLPSAGFYVQMWLADAHSHWKFPRPFHHSKQCWKRQQNTITVAWPGPAVWQWNTLHCMHSQYVFHTCSCNILRSTILYSDVDKYVVIRSVICNIL